VDAAEEALGPEVVASDVVHRVNAGMKALMVASRTERGLEIVDVVEVEVNDISLKGTIAAIAVLKGIGPGMSLRMETTDRRPIKIILVKTTTRGRDVEEEDNADIIAAFSAADLADHVLTLRAVRVVSMATMKDRTSPTTNARAEVEDREDQGSTLAVVSEEDVGDHCVGLAVKTLI